MSWHRLRWWLFGALAYLTFLSFTLPAQYVVGWLGKRMPEVRLSGVTGTLLSGRAEELSWQSVRLGSLQWSFDWLAPFTASCGYRFVLQTGDQTLTGRADVRGSHLWLRGFDGRLPVSLLDRWLPLPSHSVSGMLEMHLRQVDFNAGRLQSAEGEVQLQEATLAWPQAYALGSFRMTLSPASPDGLNAALSDLASPLKLQANLGLTAAGAYHLAGTLGARDPSDSATRTLLAALGTPDSTGQYPFDFKGQW